MPGRIEQNGNLRNSKGLPIGNIDSHGTIHDSRGIKKVLLLILMGRFRNSSS